MAITVRYFAAASTAAGREEQTFDRRADVPLSELIGAIGAEHGALMQRTLAASSYLVDGVSIIDHTTTVGDGQRVDILPPFAGG